VSGGNRRIADACCFRAIRAQDQNPVLRAEWARLMSSSMAQPISTQPDMATAGPAPHRITSVVVVGAAALGGAVLLGAGVLWFHYGTAVFFEMITSGIAACF
jgi:hypothetical protein